MTTLTLSPEWLEEIRRRCAEIDAGRAQLLDGDEVMARLFKSFEPDVIK
jgi:hypothetical protein